MCARFLLYGIRARARVMVFWSLCWYRPVGPLGFWFFVGILGIGFVLGFWGIWSAASVASGDLGFLLGWVFVVVGVCCGRCLLGLVFVGIFVDFGIFFEVYYESILIVEKFYILYRY